MNSTKSKTNPKAKTNYILGIMLVLLIVISVVLAVCLKPSNARKPIIFNTSAKYVEGIDVSSHNGEIDWKEVSENTDFAIIRAGYRGYSTDGVMTQDKNFDENIKNALKHKIPVGVYFYTQAVTVEEAKEEANFVLNIIKGHNIELPVFIDYEFASDANGDSTGRLYGANLTKEQATEVVNAFCTEIQKAGYHAGVYSSSNVFNFHLNSEDFVENAFVWVADYNKTVKFTGSYDVWQYSKSGSCPGVNSKYCDVNRWYVNN